MMNLSLPPELEQFLREKVASGQYLCEEEVIRESLYFFRQWHQFQEVRTEELRRAIAVGIEQADRGEVIAGDEVFRRLREKIDQTIENKEVVQVPPQ